MQQIYLDNHATTRTDPRVLDAMTPYFCEAYGNSASPHCFGNQANSAVEKARGQVAKLIGAKANEIIFTSGATESNNMALLGIARALASKGNRIISSEIEHRSILDPLTELKRQGFDVVYLPTAKNGVVELNDLKHALNDKTILISIMLANNEIGTINPVNEIGLIAKQHGILFHCDAVQGTGKISINLASTAIDLLSLSAHKMYGPKGVGALYVRSGNAKLRLEPISFGGGQERQLRSGTLNVPGIVGLGHACELAIAEMAEDQARILKLRSHLLTRLQHSLDNITVHGDLNSRLAGNLNLGLPIEGSVLFKAMPNVAISSISACSSTKTESHVLLALGLDESTIRRSVRIGIGKYNTSVEIDLFADLLINTVKQHCQRPQNTVATARLNSL